MIRYVCITEPEQKFLSKFISMWPKDKKFTFFDVGSNEGGYTLFILDHIDGDYDGHLFEPVERNIRSCRGKFSKLENITLNNIAIDESGGVKTFYETSNPVLGSLSNRMGGKQIKVDSTTIQSYMNIHKINHIDLLKIDTEGSESNIIHSCDSLLKENRISVIQFEWGINTWKAFGSELDVTFNFLTSHNFSFFLWSYHDGEGLKTIDSNYILENKLKSMDVYALHNNFFLIDRFL